MNRVLFLIPTLDRSGSEKQLSLLAAGLPRNEFDIRVVCLTRGGSYEKELQRAGIPVDILHKRMKLDPIVLWRLRQVISEFKPHIIHTWLTAANSYGRLVGCWMKIPVTIATERCVDRWKSPWHFPVDRWLSKKTDRLVVNSQGVAKFYRDHGVSGDRIQVIVNGIDPIKSQKYDRKRIREQIQLPEDACVIGYVGRLATQKRIRDLIWAADILKLVLPKVYLLIVGDGPQRHQLRQFARDCQILDRVKFFGHCEEVESLYSAMDVFWLGSEYEGMPNSVMEAMASGLPVVATNVPGVNELVIEGKTGYLIPVGDRAEMAQKTFRLFENPSLAQQFGNSGRLRMEQFFSTQDMIESHVSLYRELLASHAEKCEGVVQ